MNYFTEHNFHYHISESTVLYIQKKEEQVENYVIIRKKAKFLYTCFKQEKSDERTDMNSMDFQTSKGGFDQFRMTNVKIMEKAAFADQEFHKILQKIIEENGYFPEQMVNTNETALFYLKGLTSHKKRKHQAKMEKN